MSRQTSAIVFASLLVFILAWSVGLAKPLVEWFGPESDLGSYFINKGVLTLVMALVFWRLRIFAAIGFTRGMGWASYVIGLPLFALGILSLLDPGRAALTPVEVGGWLVVVMFVAFTEETLFRGVLWHSLGTANVWVRAATTSFFFGLVHFIPAGLGDYGWDIAAVYGLSAMGFGMIFAAMREQAGTIWSVIVIHAVFDLAAISSAGSVSDLLEPGLETYIRFLTAAFVFGFWGSAAIWLVERHRKRAEGA